MTSRTYLVEVRDDGMVAIGELTGVTRTVQDIGTWPGDGRMTRRLTVTGTLVSATVKTAEEAQVVLKAGAILASTTP